MVHYFNYLNVSMLINQGKYVYSIWNFATSACEP